MKIAIKEGMLVFCLWIISCTKTIPLTERQKLDSIKPGMTLQEVMTIYGLKDTINRTRLIAQQGYLYDSITDELILDTNTPISFSMVEIDSNTNLMFTNGILQYKPEYTAEEMKKDTLLNRILNETRP